MWGLEADGYRKSYGIVTSMFGITIFACYAFKIILSRLNKKLERGELEWDAREDVANQTAEMEGTTVDEALSMRVSYSLLYASLGDLYDADSSYRRDFAIWCNHRESSAETKKKTKPYAVSVIIKETTPEQLDMRRRRLFLTPTPDILSRTRRLSYTAWLHCKISRS